MCTTCQSTERTRLVWLVLERLLEPETPLDAAHFAPEKGIAKILRDRCGQRYRAFDYDPARYPLEFMDVEKIDLCDPIDLVPSGSLDLVLHNHVLEHVPCNPWRVLRNLDTLLRPGGVHVFTLPMTTDYYREDLDPALSPEERLRLFGQDDHMRMFGRKDLRNQLAAEFGRDVHFSRSVEIGEAELRQAGIPLSVLDTVNSHTVFVHRRD